jgi:dihydroxyacid dehydratase/phosphogluconate dehydratase
VFPADQGVIYPVSHPLTRPGCVVGLKGKLAAEGTIVKIVGAVAMLRNGALLRLQGGWFRAVQDPRLQIGRQHHHPL